MRTSRDTANLLTGVVGPVSDATHAGSAGLAIVGVRTAGWAMHEYVAVASMRWGVAGTGRIAALVADDFPFVPDAELVAVGSRSQERAEAFAQAYELARAHGSYAELIADPQVDVVYIATPHPQHHAIAIAALRAGKAVLVEKAFTATLAGAEEVVSEARRLGIFAMEAMWTRFQPAVVRARRPLAQGAIREVGSLP